MKYPTVKFVFDRKNVATKTKKGLIQIEYSHDDMQRTKTLSVANRKEAKTNVNNCHLEKT